MKQIKSRVDVGVELKEVAGASLCCHLVLFAFNFDPFSPSLEHQWNPSFSLLWCDKALLCTPDSRGPFFFFCARFDRHAASFTSLVYSSSFLSSPFIFLKKKEIDTLFTRSSINVFQPKGRDIYKRRRRGRRWSEIETVLKGLFSIGSSLGDSRVSDENCVSLSWA